VEQDDLLAKVNGSKIRRAIITDRHIIDVGDLQLTYSDPLSVSSDTDLPLGLKQSAKASKWGKKTNIPAVPFDLEPIAGADLSYTHFLLRQQSAFVTSTDLSKAVHSPHVHHPPKPTQQLSAEPPTQ